MVNVSGTKIASSPTDAQSEDRVTGSAPEPHGASVSSPLPRIEDWLLGIWMALVAPSIIRSQATTGDPFNAGSAAEGLLYLAAVVGAVVCIASRSSDQGDGRRNTALVGPFVGGLLLIGISSASALGFTSTIGTVFIILLGLVALIVRMRLTVKTIVRRALITPYILVTGNVFWGLIDAVTGGGELIGRLRAVPLSNLASVAPVAGFLLAFSAVYYAMLIYAPRQVAESEGGPVTWILRYLLFVASTLLGATWLLAFG